MRHLRALGLLLPVLLVADAGLAASKHEQTRRSASKKHADHHARSSASDESDGGSDFWGSCLSGCFSAGCDVAGRVAVEGVAEAARAADEPPPPPPAPGLEPPPEDERWPEEDAARPPRELPDELVPRAPAVAAPAGEDEEEVPAWMPGPAEPPAEFVEEEGGVAPALGVARAEPVPAIAAGPAAPAGPPSPEENGAGPDFGAPSALDSPEAFGVAWAPAPPPPPPAPESVRFDLRGTGAWIFADLPNASFDARASIGTVHPGPGLEAWYTGLWERIDGEWDHLPLGGLRFGLGLGTDAVRPQLRFGGALLHLGPRDDRFGFDAGLGLEVRAGGEGAPWIDAHGDALVFEGFTGTDLGAGVSFPGGPFYVRVGIRSLYLETFYAGPEIGLGLRL